MEEFLIGLLVCITSVWYVIVGLQNLGQSYECLDASLPWLCYWILHSLELLETPLPEHLLSSIVQFLGIVKIATFHITVKCK